MSIDDDTMAAPKIIKKLPKVVRTKAGETTTLEAQAIGKPKPVTKWRKSTEEIIPSEDYQIDNYPDGTSVLTIKNLPSETVDKITFEAASPLGVAETITELHVEGISETIQTLKKFIIIIFKFVLIISRKRLILFFQLLSATFVPIFVSVFPIYSYHSKYFFHFSIFYTLYYYCKIYTHITGATYLNMNFLPQN